MLDDLFHDVYPGSRCHYGVYVKVAALDSLYGTRIAKGHHGMVADVICDLGIDEKAKGTGALELVGELVKGLVEAEVSKYGSFASKYCAFCAYKTYSLFDQHVCRTIVRATGRHPRECGFTKASVPSLSNYLTFHETVGELMKGELSDLDRRQFDHYLWFKGQDIAKLEKGKKLLRELKERQGSMDKPWGRATRKNLATLLDFGWVEERPGIDTPQSEGDVRITAKGKKILEEG